jgi:hypothetical protein
MENLLPRFSIVDIAKHKDKLRAHELPAGLQDTAMIIFYRAYNNFGHLVDLN